MKNHLELVSKGIALALCTSLMCLLAACGGQPTPTATPAPPTPTPAPSEPAVEGTVYTTVINDADVTFTLAADQKSIVVDAMGMTVEGTCEVADNVLTIGEQTSGNAQIWASLGKNQYTLNADGTATATGGAGAGGVYTTVINDADVTFTISDDQKSIVVDAMGMTVEGTCEVVDNVLTIKEQTSGNAQIWASLGKNQYTLNADGTASIGGAEGQEPGGDDPAPAGGEELFAWEGFAALVFNKDGTYNFNYNDMVKESGTWNWENWTLTVTDANGTEMTGSVDNEDNNTLKLTFTAVANSELVVDFTAASSVWGPALGATGSYAPAD